MIGSGCLWRISDLSEALLADTRCSLVSSHHEEIRNEKSESRRFKVKEIMILMFKLFFYRKTSFCRLKRQNLTNRNPQFSQSSRSCDIGNVDAEGGSLLWQVTVLQTTSCCLSTSWFATVTATRSTPYPRPNGPPSTALCPTAGTPQINRIVASQSNNICEEGDEWWWRELFLFFFSLAYFQSGPLKSDVKRCSLMILCVHEIRP